MEKKEAIEKVKKSIGKELSVSDKINFIKEIDTVTVKAMDNNTKDYKELCEVAKKELDNNNPSSEYYNIIQKGLELCDKALEKADSVEEREKIRQEANELIEKADKREEEKNANNKETFKKVLEANKENKQINWAIVRNLGIAAIAITGGMFLGAKGKDIADKLIDKK